MKSQPLAAQAIAAACLTFLIASAATAQSYPAKPVRMIVASSAGSNPDTIGRILEAQIDKYAKLIRQIGLAQQ